MPPPPAPKVSGVATKVTAKKRKPRPKQVVGDDEKATKVRRNDQTPRSKAPIDALDVVATQGDAKSNPLAALGSYGDSDSE